VSELFEATSINGLTLANRFVRSATWEGLASPEGSPTPALVDASTELARGGVGLIISGHAFVSEEGRAGQWQLAVHDDDLIPGLRGMVDAVHAAGGRIALQIAHAGLRAVTGRHDVEPVGPSILRTDGGSTGREMTPGELRAVTDAFAQAARRAQLAGFDAVQIHAAHGYLIGQFLSPFFNKRDDGYGGDVRKRAKLAVEVVEAARAAVGLGFPVFIKLNSDDFLPGGLTVEDMVRTADMVREAGIDAVEISGGTFLSGDKKSMRQGRPGPGEPEAYYETAARRYKEEVRLPLMLVGGIRTVETAERLIAEGVTDYISLCRPLIREPALVDRWRRGDRRPASCVSDNRCFFRGLRGRGVECVMRGRGDGETSSDGPGDDPADGASAFFRSSPVSETTPIPSSGGTPCR
jgi:2,4-dienoyl-CoA reductase-like NADH-dependent reductase (Old Yellow Enzyme family)